MTHRSLLYVPGDQTNMLARSTERGADGIIVDLEDAVSLSSKGEARSNVQSWFADLHAGVSAWVRVNSEPGLLADDLSVIAGLDNLRGVLVPKAELDLVSSIDVPEHVSLIPLIETPTGALQLEDITDMPGVARLGLGASDLVAALDIDPESALSALQPLMLQMVVVSAAAGIDPPLAPTATDYRDLLSFEQSTRHLKKHGFGGRTAIHPAQVEVINRVFTPTAEEVAAAQRLLDSKAPAIQIADDGSMVDAAVLRGARRVIERAELYGTAAPGSG